MKKIIVSVVFCLCLVFANISRAQVTIAIAPPSPYFATINDLLNITLSNSGKYTYDVALHVGVYSNDGSVLLEITSNDFSLPRGIKIITAGSLTLQTDFTDNDFETSYKACKSIPPGQYTVCAWLVPYEEANILAKTCINYERRVFAPPRLVYPRDSSRLTSKFPILTWLPPVTGSFGDKITYSIAVAEIGPFQAPADALSSNSLSLSATDVPSCFYAYPMNGSPLDTGKWYAWQVQAYVRGNDIGASEIWSFTIPGDSIKKDSLPFTSSYALMRKKVDGGYYNAVKGQLKFKFDGAYSKGPLNFKIYDESLKDVSPKKAALSQKNGDNHYTLDLTNTRGMSDKSFYVLQVTSRKNETYYLRFKYLAP